MKIAVEELMELLKDYPERLEVYIGEENKEIASIDVVKKPNVLGSPQNIVRISIKD